MSKVKSGGSTKNGRDSNPKYLGIKLNHGQKADAGSIIVRQRGTKFRPGENVGIGKDDTLFAKIAGTVKISTVRKTHFDNSTVKRKKIDVVPA